MCSNAVTCTYELQYKDGRVSDVEERLIDPDSVRLQLRRTRLLDVDTHVARIVVAVLDLHLTLPPTTTTTKSTSPPKVIWEERVAVPIGYNGTPQSSPSKLPLLLRRSPTLSNTPLPRPTPLTTKWHPDPISRFATVHFPDRQTERHTDTQTDRWDRRQTCKNTRLRSMVTLYCLYSNAAKKPQLRLGFSVHRTSTEK